MRSMRLFSLSLTRLLLAGLMVLTLAAGPARAATEADYTPSLFAAAEAANRPILLHVNASWCPTCAKQRPILEKLSTEPDFKDLMIYRVDFDTQKDVVRALGVRLQSTLIVFHGAKEEGRSTGDTDEASIRTLLAMSSGKSGG